ncbi:tetratricopeptide repeat protein [Micromonospora sp. NPDC048898]|uniref:tetratricopeptide repeat protein n=1 Tax=Micromonospora sp. NPDC048898 TaxID=3364260 RepID=UPI003722DDAB
MTSETAVRTTWQRRFDAEGERQFPRLAQEALADPRKHASTQGVRKLVTLTSGVLFAADQMDSSTIGRFITLSIDTLLTVGAGTDFRDYEEFLTNAMDLIHLLEKRGVSVSGHYLSAARFQAGIANGAALRRDFIEKAVTTSHTTDEEATALLTLAKYLVDVSDYDGARAALLRCKVAMGEAGEAHLRVDHDMTLGLTYYFSDPETSRAHFQSAVTIGRNHSADRRFRQPLATALHYLGRLSVDRGEPADAIRLLCEAEAFSDDYLTGHGYFHQRLAEVLVDHGSVREAEYHLRAAERTFAIVGQASSGVHVLHGTWARWFVRTGDLRSAVDTLRAAVQQSRRHGAPRVELILLAEMLRVQLKRRRVDAAIPILARAGVVYLGSESIRGPAQFVRQALTVFQRAVRMLRAPRTVGTAGSEGRPVPVQCLCGADHDPSQEEA